MAKNQILNPTHSNLLQEAQMRKTREEQMRQQEQATRASLSLEVRRAALNAAVQLVKPEVRNGVNGVEVTISTEAIINIAHDFETYLYKGAPKIEESEKQKEDVQDHSQRSEQTQQG